MQTRAALKIIIMIILVNTVKTIISGGAYDQNLI